MGEIVITTDHPGNLSALLANEQSAESAIHPTLENVIQVLIGPVGTTE